MNTVGEVLESSPLPRLEARLLLMHASGLSRTRIMAWPESPLEPAALARFLELQQRRVAGEPIAYLLGEREFYGRTFRVGPGVLIPRPETEQLVDLALEKLRDLHRPRLVDLGTGSGVIAISVAAAQPLAEVWAVDASSAALQMARHNAEALGVSVQFEQGSWYEPLPAEQRFDLILSNPPYIEAGDIHLQQGDLRFEPAEALTDFADGLSCLRAIYGAAVHWLRPQGWVLAEHGYDQGPACRHLCETAGLSQVQTWRDLAGLERITGGCWRPD